MNFLRSIFLAITMIVSAGSAADKPKDSTPMTLNLSNQQLSNVPEDVFFHSSLEELWLDDNQTRELPDAIAELTTLKRLSIYKNQLCVFPKVLLQMATLERINGSQNRLESIPAEIKNLEKLEVLDLNYNELRCLPDELSELLPRDQWFLQMNFRNVPKSWYDYNFDSTPLWQGVKPNTHVLDQIYLRFARKVDVSQGLESLDLSVLIAYGRFEFLVAPVHSWDPLRPKFKNLTVRIFEKSAHSPQY